MWKLFWEVENAADNYSRNYRNFQELFDKHSAENPLMVYQFIYAVLNQAILTKYLLVPTINAVKMDILKLNSAIVESDTPAFDFKEIDASQLEECIQKPNRNVVRMMLKTLAYEQQDERLPERWEIEHIFPQKWQTNYFPNMSDEIIGEKIEHIGNKLPFEKRLNIVAGNGYFGKKKEAYTNSKIAITKAMGTSGITEWDMDSITKRDIRISDAIMEILSRWDEEYLNSIC